MRRGLILLLCVAASFCQSKPSATPEQVQQKPAENLPVVVLPDGFRVTCEIAADEPTRSQGLMYRDRIEPGRGMLFFFPQAGFYPFWMKNTLIPLDMIWITDAKKVVSVSANVPPCGADPCPTYSPAGNAIYVLELAAGEAAAHKVKAGDTLQFIGTENIAGR